MVASNSYQRALITGATSGIGAAFAAELPSHTDLLLTGRNSDALVRVAEGLASPGRIVETYVADLADEAEVRRLVDKAEAFGVDLLINNAGVGQLGRVIDNDLEQERATVAVNVLAVLLLTRGLMPGMLERARRHQRRAGIIIVSSTAALTPIPLFATYSASKAFDLYLAEALSEELRADPIDVLALCPGATRTSFGTRAGFAAGNFPGAADPRRVARDGLEALGRCPVKVSGTFDHLAFGALLHSRPLLTSAVGTAMRAVTNFFKPPAAP